MVYPRMPSKSILIRLFVKLVMGHLARIAIRSEKRKDLLALVKSLLFLDLECNQVSARQNDITRSNHLIRIPPHRQHWMRESVLDLPVLFERALFQVDPTGMRYWPTPFERTPVPDFS